MLTRLYSLICDGCGAWSTRTQGFSTSKLARAHARRQGWMRSPASHRPVKDWCPRCVGRRARDE